MKKEHFQEIKDGFGWCDSHHNMDLCEDLKNLASYIKQMEKRIEELEKRREGVE